MLFNNTKSLKDMILEIAECTETINTPIESIEPRFAPAWGIRKTQATEKIESLRKTYQDEASKAMNFIFVQGPAQESNIFGGLARDFANSFWIDTKKLSNDLADVVEVNLIKNKNVMLDHLLGLSNHLDSVRQKLGLEKKLPIVDSTLYRSVTTREQTVKLVSDFLALNLEPEFWMRYIKNVALETALETKFDKDVFPIVVTGLNKETIEAINGLANKFTVKLTNTKIVDKTFVFETLKKIRTQLKIKTIEEKQSDKEN